MSLTASPLVTDLQAVSDRLQEILGRLCGVRVTEEPPSPPNLLVQLLPAVAKMRRLAREFENFRTKHGFDATHVKAVYAELCQQEAIVDDMIRRLTQRPTVPASGGREPPDPTVASGG